MWRSSHLSEHPFLIKNIGYLFHHLLYATVDLLIKLLSMLQVFSKPIFSQNGTKKVTPQNFFQYPYLARNLSILNQSLISVMPKITQQLSPINLFSPRTVCTEETKLSIRLKQLYAGLLCQHLTMKLVSSFSCIAYHGLSS